MAPADDHRVVALRHAPSTSASGGAWRVARRPSQPARVAFRRRRSAAAPIPVGRGRSVDEFDAPVRGPYRRRHRGEVRGWSRRTSRPTPAGRRRWRSCRRDSDARWPTALMFQTAAVRTSGDRRHPPDLIATGSGPRTVSSGRRRSRGSRHVVGIGHAWSQTAHRWRHGRVLRRGHRLPRSGHRDGARMRTTVPDDRARAHRGIDASRRRCAGIASRSPARTRTCAQPSHRRRRRRRARRPP